ILLNDRYIKNRMYIEGIATLINILLNFSLIPLLDVKGAIISVILTEFIIAVSFEISVVKELKIKMNKIIYLAITLIYLTMYINVDIYIKMIFSFVLLVISIKMIIVRVKMLWKT
ncbi:polysaccharide biosynthesis C-terminal domain-containing protein, partial [Staphylococcus cohnii]|uniref:polysaccharide biosynthesis C-terminal domain-containing protein n=1 Tax=Staphylococcus cohnii TaxID=29382 RepID=UPI0018E54BAB